MKRTAVMAFIAVLAGCAAWLNRVDPPVDYHRGPGCHELGDEPCGKGGCCDGWHDWHCQPLAQRCEFHPDTMGSSAPDAGPLGDAR